MSDSEILAWMYMKKIVRNFNIETIFEFDST